MWQLFGAILYTSTFHRIEVEFERGEFYKLRSQYQSVIGLELKTVFL